MVCRGAVAVFPVGAQHPARGHRALRLLDVHHLPFGRPTFGGRCVVAGQSLWGVGSAHAVRARRRRSASATGRRCRGAGGRSAGGSGGFCALGPVSAAHLAALHHGRPHARVGVDARGHRQCGRLSVQPLRAAADPRAGRVAPGFRRRLGHGLARLGTDAHAKRHQEVVGLLHHGPDGLHDHGVRPGGVFTGGVSPHCARSVQGHAVSWLGQCHWRHPAR